MLHIKTRAHFQNTHSSSYFSPIYVPIRSLLMIVSLVGGMHGMIGCDSGQVVNELSAGEITAGEVTAGEMTAGEVTAGEMTSGEMTSGEMTSGEMTAGEMTAGEMTAGEPPVVASDVTTLSVRALNPLSGSGVEGMTAELATEPLNDEMGLTGVTNAITTMDGVAAFGAQLNTTYEVVLTSDQHAPHHILGDLGDEPAEQVTFVSTFSLTNQVFSLLNLTPDPNKGIVVVGLDLPNLAPAVGASAELNQEYESAFVFGAVAPSTGQTVLAGGGGFVSFANVTPGEALITVTPPESSLCTVFPAERRDQPRVQVYPGEVTVIAFTCRAE